MTVSVTVTVTWSVMVEAAGQAAELDAAELDDDLTAEVADLTVCEELAEELAEVTATLAGAWPLFARVMPSAAFSLLTAAAIDEETDGATETEVTTGTVAPAIALDTGRFSLPRMSPTGA